MCMCVYVCVCSIVIEFGLDSLRAQIDRQAIAMCGNEERSVQSRKALAEQLKGLFFSIMGLGLVLVMIVLYTVHAVHGDGNQCSRFSRFEESGVWRKAAFDEWCDQTVSERG